MLTYANTEATLTPKRRTPVGLAAGGAGLNQPARPLTPVGGYGAPPGGQSPALGAATGSGINTPVTGLPGGGGPTTGPNAPPPGMEPLPLGDAVGNWGGIGPPTAAGSAGALRPTMPVNRYAPAPNAQGGAGGGSPYATMTSFGPGQDMRGTAITPGQSPTLDGLDQTVSNALGHYTGYQMPGFQGVGAGSYTPSANATAAGGMLQGGLQSLQSTPDRDVLARQSLQNLQPLVQEQFDRMIRQGGQAASKFGTIGAGFTTSALGDVTRSVANDFGRNATDMSLNAAGQTMGDRLARVGAYQGAMGAYGNEDRSNAGVQQSLRNEARGERGAGLDYSQQLFNNAGQQLGAASNIQGGQRAYEAGQRDELRGERTNQNATENQAYQRSVQGTALADALQGSQFNRAMQLLGAGQGSTTDLASLLTGSAGQQYGQAQGGMNDIASIISSILANNRPPVQTPARAGG